MKYLLSFKDVLGRSLPGGLEAFAILYLSIAIPTFCAVDEIGGITVTFICFSIFAILFLIAKLNAVHNLSSIKIPFILIGLFISCVLILTVSIIHPIIDTEGLIIFGKRIGPSDGDNALVTAASSLISGVYQYYEKTFLGNPISLLPGGVILAIPFIAIGIPLQNLFWMGALIAFLIKCGLRLPTAVLIAFIPIISPIFNLQLLQGIDYSSNNIYILISLGFLLYSIQKGCSKLTLFLIIFISGLLLSSRITYLFLLPILYFSIKYHLGYKLAATITCSIIVVLVFVTAPFYFYDPEGFSPFHVVKKIDHTYNVTTAKFLVVAVTIALGIFLGHFCNGTLMDFYKRCFLVQLMLFFFSSILAWASDGTIPWDNAHYGTLFCYFGIVWGGKKVFEPNKHRE